LRSNEERARACEKQANMNEVKYELKKYERLRKCQIAERESQRRILKHKKYVGVAKKYKETKIEKALIKNAIEI